MFNQFEDIQKMSKDNIDLAVKSFGATSKSVQAIATETADYSKKAFEHSSSVMEKLVGIKTLDKAFEIQSDFAKSAYEGFVATLPRLVNSTPTSPRTRLSHTKQ